MSHSVQNVICNSSIDVQMNYLLNFAPFTTHPVRPDSPLAFITFPGLCRSDTHCPYIVTNALFQSQDY